MKTVVSTHLFLYHDIIDKDVLGVIAGAGFDAVELWGMKPHFPYNDAQKVERIRSMGKNAGVEFHSIHLPMYERIYEAKELRMAFSPSSEDAESRRRWKVAGGESARAAAGLGALYMTAHTDLNFPAPPAPMKLARESFKAFIEEELPPNSAVCLENDIGGEEQIEGLLSLLEGLDESKAGITLDMGHALVGGDNVAGCIRTAGKRLKVIHAHDNDGTSDAHLPPVRGCMKWDKVANALESVGFSGPFVWEIRDPTAGRDPDMVELKKILEETKRFEYP